MMKCVPAACAEDKKQNMKATKQGVNIRFILNTLKKQNENWYL